MEMYNVFKLFVVKYDDMFYICKKEDEKFIDIFFEEEINSKEGIQYLASYYMVETMQKLAKGEDFYLTKKELLIKFAMLNAINIRKNIEQSYPNNILDYKDEYLKAFKELSNKKPDIAKRIAEEKIKKLRFNME